MRYMKMNLGVWAFSALALLASCSEKDIAANVPTPEPEFTQEELAEMAAVEKFAAANSVYRALALIDELPDNWEGTTYTPEVGVPVNEAESDVRNVVSTGADHAKGYFLSIVPDHGLDGDTWSHEGVGTLTYRAVNEENCYAVIDVNLVQMPGLRQLRFVPEAVVGENSFNGEPYYHVGDLVKDKKGIYWICVRPAGGPLKKDKAYFVSFDKSLIKTATQNQTIYKAKDGDLTKEKNTDLTGKWTYAKNLVEERIAIAAGHTFAMFYGARRIFYEENPYSDFGGKAYCLNFPLEELLLWCDKNNPFESPKTFAIAYGSYEKNKYTTVRQEKYLQPYMVIHHKKEFKDGKIEENVDKTWEGYSLLYSLTTEYEPLSYDTYRELYLSDDEDDKEQGYNHPFNILDYAITFDGEHFVSDNNGKGMYYGMNGTAQVLVMTQTSVKDHGKPYSGFTKVGTEEDLYDEPNYWKSLDNTARYVRKADGYILAEDIYE